MVHGGSHCDNSKFTEPSAFLMYAFRMALKTTGLPVEGSLVGAPVFLSKTVTEILVSKCSKGGRPQLAKKHVSTVMSENVQRIVKS